MDVEVSFFQLGRQYVTVKLTRLNNDNLLDDVQAQWQSQITDDEGMPIEQLEVYFNQAKRVMREKYTPDDRGMFVLETEQVRHSDYDAMCFINHAWSKGELRIVTLYLAPKFDTIEHRTVKIAAVFANLIANFVQLARSQWVASHVKIYIQDNEFRALAMGIASSFAVNNSLVTVDVKSGWLHIDGVDQLN